MKITYLIILFLLNLSCSSNNFRQVASVANPELITEAHELKDDYCFRYEAGIKQDKQQAYLEGNRTGFSLMGSFRILESGEKRFDGFDISSKYYGEKRNQVDGGIESETDFVYPNRSYDFDFEGRGNFITFSVIDMPVKEIYKNVNSNGKIEKKLHERYESTSIRITNYNFFPRVLIPDYELANQEVTVLLPTGEKAIFDEVTGKVKNGVFREIETSQNISKSASSNLIFPNKSFEYVGVGIWIESRITGAADEREPGHKVKIKAWSQNKLQVCTVMSQEVFKECQGFRLAPEHPKYSSSKYSCIKLKQGSDQEFFDFIKFKCPNFIIPKF